MLCSLLEECCRVNASGGGKVSQLVGSEGEAGTDLYSYSEPARGLAESLRAIRARSSEFDEANLPLVVSSPSRNVDSQLSLSRNEEAGGHCRYYNRTPGSN